VESQPSFTNTQWTMLRLILLILCNKILQIGIFPQPWGKSIFTPFHKSCPKIFLVIIGVTMYKIFAGVINKRFYVLTERYSKIDESQAGFRSGYSADDYIFCLQAMM
jgi:hypothetical protein